MNAQFDVSVGHPRQAYPFPKTLNVITLRRWQGGPARPVMPIAHRQRAQALLPP